jgi:integrase
MTLAEYLRQWLENQSMRLSPNTYDGYSVNIEKHIIPSIGNTPLCRLSKMQIESFYNEKLKKGRADGKGGLSVTSVRYIHATLRAALNDAVDMEYIVKNFANTVKLPKQKDYEPSFLTKKQVDTMLEVFRNTNIFIPVLLAVGLGLRRGEALGLKWEDIDFEKNIISVKRALLPAKGYYNFADLKTAKSRRTLTVPKNIIECLKKEKCRQSKNKLFLGTGYKNMDLVCCNDDGSPITPTALNHRFSKFLIKNDLQTIRFHDLRHTNASLMLKQGVSMKVASDRLGHTTIGITMDLYTHIDAELQQDAANKLNAIFGG